VILGIALKSGLLEIARHKTRSFLSFFAIAIGAASFYLSFSYMYGGKRQMEDGFNLAGRARLDISRDSAYMDRGISPGLTYADAGLIAKEFPELNVISPKSSQWARVSYENFEAESDVAGVLMDWAKIGWVYKLRGRFITQDDIDSNSKVCVLIQEGGWLRKKPAWRKLWKYQEKLKSFIKHNDLLGKDVLIGVSGSAAMRQGESRDRKQHLFRVVGILEEPPQDDDPRWFGTSGDEIIMPFSTFRKYLSGSDRLDGITVDCGDAKKLPFYKTALEKLLAARHNGEKDFMVRDFAEQMASIMSRIQEQLITIIAIGAVALLAGGIGIMNVTLAIINSRVKEIGIRRALGARRADILLQFVVEAVLLGFIGGSAGTALGWVAVDYLSRDEQSLRYFAFWIPAVSVLIAMAVSFLFAIVPAWKASRLEPVDALRYE